MNKITSGRILIGGVDLNTYSLTQLRNMIAYIPQEPFLFEGTLSDNLDPLHKHSKEKLLKILNDSKLQTTFN